MPPRQEPVDANRLVTNTEQSEQQRWDAMLYVLRDPSIDIDTFEKRMENEPDLVDAVVWATDVVIAMQSESNSLPASSHDSVVAASLDRLTDAAQHSVRVASSANESSMLNWGWLLTVCASFLMAAFFWQASNKMQVIDNGADRIVQAWSQFQSDGLTDNDLVVVSNTQRRSSEEDEDGLVDADWNSNDTAEVPDWLILVTASNNLEKELLQ